MRRSPLHAAMPSSAAAAAAATVALILGCARATVGLPGATAGRPAVSIRGTFAPSLAGASPVCGRACQTDHDCPDQSGVCTYCTDAVCTHSSVRCGHPLPANTTKPQYLMIGDSSESLLAPTARVAAL